VSSAKRRPLRADGCFGLTGRFGAVYGDDVRFRVVATDIDGTLLRSDETISPRATAAIASLVERGSTFVLATGRPPRWVHPIAKLVGQKGLAVCSNGAMIVDLIDESVVHQSLHEKQNALAAVQAVLTVLPDTDFAVDGPSGFGHTSGYTSVFAHGRQAREAPMHELLDGQLTKIMFRHQDMSVALLDELVAQMGDAVTVTFGSMGSDFGPKTLIELMPFGVNKAAALLRIAEHHDAGASDVIAFGDMPNDMDMLRWAGHGVAMGNAHPAIKEIADEVTASNDDDGVAIVLERELTLMQ
jgi:Cof subfamily protein (haloacid dehalogenase superfamily)